MYSVKVLIKLCKAVSNWVVLFTIHIYLYIIRVIVDITIQETFIIGKTCLKLLNGVKTNIFIIVGHRSLILRPYIICTLFEISTLFLYPPPILKTCQICCMLFSVYNINACLVSGRVFTSGMHYDSFLSLQNIYVGLETILILNKCTLCIQCFIKRPFIKLILFERAIPFQTSSHILYKSSSPFWQACLHFEMMRWISV